MWRGIQCKIHQKVIVEKGFPSPTLLRSFLIYFQSINLLAVEVAMASTAFFVV